MQFITFDGRLGKNAEVLTTKGGTKYLRFSVANNTFNNGTKTTEWYDVTSYDPYVIENRAEHLKKGTYVIISGPIRYSISTKDGKIWQNYYVNANSIDTPPIFKEETDETNAVVKESNTPEVSTYTGGTASQAVSAPTIPVAQPAQVAQPTYQAQVTAPAVQPSYSGTFDDNNLPF